MNYSLIDVRPKSGSVGAEIFGVDLNKEISIAVKNYTTEVKNQDFPNNKEQY